MISLGGSSMRENYIMNNLDWKSRYYYYLSFIIWPFGTTLAAFNNYDKSFSKDILWLFCIFFGLTFVVAEEGGADSARYATSLIQYAHSEMNLRELWQSFYSDSSGYVDILQPMVTYLVSRFTDNPTILFTIFGLIFGYFYSRNIWYILDRIEGKIAPPIFVFILTLAVLNPIWNINGFRMWAAAQIFLYGALRYLLDGKGKGLIWTFASVFVHFSFMFPLAALVLFYFLKNRINFYLGFFILTSFIKELDLGFIRDSLSFLPGFLQPRVSGYTNLDYAEFRMDRFQLNNWYIQYSVLGIKWAVYAMALSIYFFHNKYIKQRQDLLTLFCFSLVIYSFANLFSLVPSGGRMIVVANTFMFSFFVMFFSRYNKNRFLTILRFLTIPLLLLFCIVSLRTGMDFYGLVTIIGNPIFAVFSTDIIPLIESIKQIF